METVDSSYTTLAWITDPHLDHLPSVDSSKQFAEYLCEEKSFDAVLITGDIAKAPCVCARLEAFVIGLGGKPVYFVLGNHDFYKGSLEAVRTEVNQLAAQYPQLHYLTSSKVIKLNPEIALVGDDGWYDGLAEDAVTSRVIMADDFMLIKDLRTCFPSDVRKALDLFVRGDRSDLLSKLLTLSTQSANRLEPKLRAAAEEFPRVLVATHVPPYEEACIHNGQISDTDWRPWFTNVTMGKMLSRVFAEYLEVKFDVFCGHTHSSGLFRPTPNANVYTGKAQYGYPDVITVLELWE